MPGLGNLEMSFYAKWISIGLSNQTDVNSNERPRHSTI